MLRGCLASLGCLTVCIKALSMLSAALLPPLAAIFSRSCATVMLIFVTLSILRFISRTRYKACPSSKIASFKRLDFKRAALSQLME